MGENDNGNGTRAVAQFAAAAANIAKGAAEGGPMELRLGPSKASCPKSSRPLPGFYFFCCACR